MTTSKAELAYIALEAKLKTVAGLGQFNSLPHVSRKLKDPSQVLWDTTPALYINQIAEGRVSSKGFEGYNAKQTLRCNVYLYVYEPTVEAIPATKINDMIQAVADCLYPDKVTNTQTLGGLVQHCWIGENDIEIIEGIMDGQGIAVIPINILTNT